MYNLLFRQSGCGSQWHIDVLPDRKRLTAGACDVAATKVSPRNSSVVPLFV